MNPAWKNQKSRLSMETPCTGVCRINPQTLQCEGCLRTIDEISHWAMKSDEERSHIIRALKKRHGMSAVKS